MVEVFEEQKLLYITSIIIMFESMSYSIILSLICYIILLVVGFYTYYLFWIVKVTKKLVLLLFIIIRLFLFQVNSSKMINLSVQVIFVTSCTKV